MSENIPLWKQLEMQGMKVSVEQQEPFNRDEKREESCVCDRQLVTMKVWRQTAIKFRKLISLMQADSLQKLFGSEVLDSLITQELNRYENK